jgi:isopenicillin N synthase-like dioxygenase
VKHSIPLLDIARFDAGVSHRDAFLAQLRAAAHEAGFFYLAGHGVEPDSLRDLMMVARRFFSLP